MSNDLPIQQWWPNYPNPVNMFLCWQGNRDYQLVWNGNEIRRAASLSSGYLSEDNFQSASDTEPNESHKLPPPTATQPQQTSASTADNFRAPETATNCKDLEREATPKVPSQSDQFSSNEQHLQNIDGENQDMRPYKKRSFHSHLKSSESNMEAENSEDSEKQASSSPPLEDVEKDKDKDGETKRRKKWKRKISRKQFRHHDIKLFTPGEYRSTPLLKQKDSIAKKSDVVLKESITDLIVTTLGGQKQVVAAEKKGDMEETPDTTTNHDAEENNNTNGTQNNNNNGNIGKHNLPETPSVRKRSVDNTAMPKSNVKSIEHNFSRRMSVDMPELNAPESIVKDSEPSRKKHTTDVETSKEKMLNLNQKNVSPHLTTMEQSSLIQNSQYNGHQDKNHSQETPAKPNPEPMEIADEEPTEPENLSLRHRYSEETPVDLTKKTIETVDRHNRNSHQNVDARGTNIESRITTNNPYSTVHYHHQSDGNASLAASSNRGHYVRNNEPNYTSPSASPHGLRPTFAKDNELCDQARTILTDKIANLSRWQEVLQRLLAEPFTVHILDLMAPAFEYIERAKEETSIPQDQQVKAQQLLFKAYSVVSLKLKQLGLDVSPLFVINILGNSDPNPNKETLRQYMENIQRIKNLAINETGSKVATSQVPLSPGYVQSYGGLVRSPPPYSFHMHSRNSHLSGASSSQPRPLPLGQQGEQHLRAGGNNMSRGTAPKTGNYPNPGGYSRESSPRTGDHPMPMDSPILTKDYSIPQRHSIGNSQRTSDHPVPSGLSQRIGDYPFSQGYSRDPLQKTIDPYMHHGGVLTRPGDQFIPQVNSRESCLRGNPLLLGHPERGYLSTGGELMQQRPSAVKRTNDPSLRTDNFMPTGFNENHPGRSIDSMPVNYPRDPQFQHPGAYNIPYNRTPLASQIGSKEPLTKISGAVGRPRSKSHRTADTKSGRQNLRRSISNPQHAEMEPKHPYLEGAINMMPTSRVPTSTNDFHNALQPNSNLPPPLSNVGRNRELSVTSPTTTTSKIKVPPMYSEVFYHNLKSHVEQGNPLAISLHPFPARSYQKSSTLSNVYNEARQKQMPNVREAHQKKPEEHFVPKQGPSIPSVTSSVDEGITSSTDGVEISKVTKHASKQTPVFEKTPLPEPVSPKPTEALKCIPVAVIVADKSMQITKERTAQSDKATSIDIPEANDAVRIGAPSESNENTSSSEENLRQAFDKEQEENNTEFLVWLEKLKSNEKLKSKFLSQMGIIKKEEPAFTVGGDPIEIVDSDEEESHQSDPQKDKMTQESAGNSPKNNHKPRGPEKETIKVQTTNTNSKEMSVSYEIPVQTASSTVMLNTSVNKVSVTSRPSEAPRKSPPTQSLSKKDYILPIPLPFVPISNGQDPNYSPAVSEKSKKLIYSPEIEPISPVGNEAAFIFPDVPKVLSPLSESVSPTYQKRKKNLPGYQSNESTSIKTDYPSDNAVKRRKSLDRPEVTRSPRMAPSGKLCYVRENHMFLRYFDDTQVDLFIRNLSTQDEDLGMSKGHPDQLAKTEIIYLPRDVEFSEKEDIPEVEEFIKETTLVDRFVPKDFADFYRYVTGFQIIKNKHPVSLQTFLTMYNTNRTSELLRKYLERDEVVSRKR